MEIEDHDPGDVTVAFTTHDPVLANALASFLHDEGIAASVSERLLLKGGIFTTDPRPGLTYELLVLSRDSSEAKELIEDFMKWGPSQDGPRIG